LPAEKIVWGVPEDEKKKRKTRQVGSKGKTVGKKGEISARVSKKKFSGRTMWGTREGAVEKS